MADGASVIRLGLQHNKTLESLWLHSNGLGEKDLMHIASGIACSKLKRFDAAGNDNCGRNFITIVIIILVVTRGKIKKYWKKVMQSVN